MAKGSPSKAPAPSTQPRSPSPGAAKTGAAPEDTQARDATQSQDQGGAPTAAPETETADSQGAESQGAESQGTGESGGQAVNDASENSPPPGGGNGGGGTGKGGGTGNGGGNGNGGDNGGGNGGGDGTSAVNGQILAAVETTNAAVLDVAEKEAQSIAYQKVAQAAAFAVQDATDYLRNVEAIALAAQGVALKLMIEQDKVDQYATIMTKAQEAVTAAQKNLQSVGDSATAVTNEFPPASG